MINLLDAQTQRHYQAARLNMRLRSYFTLLLVAIGAILLFFAAGVYVTRSERTVAQAELTAGQASVREYDSVRKQAEDFTANLKIAKSILSQEVLYSDMIVQVAKTLPSRAILGSLALDQATLSKPITLSARVKAKADAVTLKNTLEASPLFDNVNINSIFEEDLGDDPPRIKSEYPVAVILSMNVSKGQPGSLLP